MMKAVLLVSHGSHSPKTKDEVQELLAQLKAKGSAGIFEYAFLEIESPNIPQGIQACVDQGAKEVVVLLNFLNSGKHVDEDIPKIVEKAKTNYTDIAIRITKPIGQHPDIHQLFSDLI